MRLQSNVAGVSRQYDRTIRVRGPVLRIQSLLMAMTRAGDCACHVENHIAVEIEIELSSCLKQSKSRLRRNSSGVIHVRSGPRTAAGPVDHRRPPKSPTTAW